MMAQDQGTSQALREDLARLEREGLARARSGWLRRKRGIASPYVVPPGGFEKPASAEPEEGQPGTAETRALVVPVPPGGRAALNAHSDAWADELRDQARRAAEAEQDAKVRLAAEQERTVQAVRQAQQIQAQALDEYELALLRAKTLEETVAAQGAERDGLVAQLEQVQEQVRSHQATAEQVEHYRQLLEVAEGAHADAAAELAAAREEQERLFEAQEAQAARAIAQERERAAAQETRAAKAEAERVAALARSADLEEQIAALDEAARVESRALQAQVEAAREEETLARAQAEREHQEAMAQAEAVMVAMRAEREDLARALARAKNDPVREELAARAERIEQELAGLKGAQSQREAEAAQSAAQREVAHREQMATLELQIDQARLAREEMAAQLTEAQGLAQQAQDAAARATALEEALAAERSRALAAAEEAQRLAGERLALVEQMRAEKIESAAALTALHGVTEQLARAQTERDADREERLTIVRSLEALAAQAQTLPSAATAMPVHTDDQSVVPQPVSGEKPILDSVQPARAGRHRRHRVAAVAAAIVLVGVGGWTLAQQGLWAGTGIEASHGQAQTQDRQGALDQAHRVIASARQVVQHAATTTAPSLLAELTAAADALAVGASDMTPTQVLAAALELQDLTAEVAAVKGAGGTAADKEPEKKSTTSSPAGQKGTVPAVPAQAKPAPSRTPVPAPSAAPRPSSTPEPATKPQSEAKPKPKPKPQSTTPSAKPEAKPPASSKPAPTATTVPAAPIVSSLTCEAGAVVTFTVTGAGGVKLAITGAARATKAGASSATATVTLPSGGTVRVQASTTTGKVNLSRSWTGVCG